jgi:hypothetical protein
VGARGGRAARRHAAPARGAHHLGRRPGQARRHLREAVARVRGRRRGAGRAPARRRAAPSRSAPLPACRAVRRAQPPRPTPPPPPPPSRCAPLPACRAAPPRTVRRAPPPHPTPAPRPPPAPPRQVRLGRARGVAGDAKPVVPGLGLRQRARRAVRAAGRARGRRRAPARLLLLLGRDQGGRARRRHPRHALAPCCLPGSHATQYRVSSPAAAGADAPPLTCARSPQPPHPSPSRCTTKCCSSWRAATPRRWSSHLCDAAPSARRLTRPSTFRARR